MRAAIDACAHRVARGLKAVAERKAAMPRAVPDERATTLQALAEREADTIARREALAADRMALDSEIVAMEVAVRRQDSRVLHDVGGALFKTSRTTITAMSGSVLEAIFSGRHTITASEDGQVFIDRDCDFIDRDCEHFGLILNFLRDCGSDSAADALRALPGAQPREVRGELDYYCLDHTVFPDRFSHARCVASIC